MKNYTMKKIILMNGRKLLKNDLEIAYIIIDEIEYSIKKPKKNKSLRADQIHAEFMQYGIDAIRKVLQSFFNTENKSRS